MQKLYSKGFEIRGPLRELAVASSSTPSHAQDSQIRWRISVEFSPIPAVNTRLSRPPNTAASAPISLAARYTKYSTAKVALGSAALKKLAHIIADTRNGEQT